MAQLKTFLCDVCNAQRKDANHWYILDTTAKIAVISKWDEELAETMEFHLCGEGCLQKKLSEVIVGWGNAAEPLIDLPRFTPLSAPCVCWETGKFVWALGCQWHPVESMT